MKCYVIPCSALRRIDDDDDDDDGNYLRTETWRDRRLQQRALSRLNQSQSLLLPSAINSTDIACLNRRPCSRSETVRDVAQCAEIKRPPKHIYRYFPYIQYFSQTLSRFI